MSDESLVIESLLRKRRRPVPRQKRLGLGMLTHGSLIQQAERLFHQAWIGYGLLLVVGTVSLASRRPEYLSAFVAIWLASLLPIFCWLMETRKGAPVLPVFILQQAAVYLIPLYSENVTLEGYSPEVIRTSASSIGLLFLLLPLGWYLGIHVFRPRPSRKNISLTGEGGMQAKAMSVALILLGIGFGFEFSMVAGWILDLLPGESKGFVSILRTFATASEMLGALLGGYSVSMRAGASKAFLYWGLLAGICFLSVSGILISSATAIVVATTIGLAAGGRRLPWFFLCVALGIVSFLNLGKFTMRDRHWQEGEAQAIGLSSLPALFAEWAEASVEKMKVGGYIEEESGKDNGEKGQTLLERINNYQNLTFVVNAQETLHCEPLWGGSYKLIPPLFIPRFLWANKPRTHEGQILLNIHYGRQGSVEDTEKTYIAWGLLPEAVGNFGPYLGAIFLGPVLGFLFGMLERWSIRKRLFSVEGMTAAALLLQVLLSFEMAASVFLTSTFQMVIAVVVGASILRMILGSEDSGRSRLRLKGSV